MHCKIDNLFFMSAKKQNSQAHKTVTCRPLLRPGDKDLKSEHKKCGQSHFDSSVRQVLSGWN